MKHLFKKLILEDQEAPISASGQRKILRQHEKQPNIFLEVQRAYSASAHFVTPINLL